MNLENLGVQEMNAQEVKNVEGGFFGAGLLLACCVAIINDWDNFKNGLMGRAER